MTTSIRLILGLLSVIVFSLEVVIQLGNMRFDYGDFGKIVKDNDFCASGLL